MLLIRLAFSYVEVHVSRWFLAAFVPKFSDCTPLMRQFLIGTLATFRLYISQILARLNRLANCSQRSCDLRLVPTGLSKKRPLSARQEATCADHIYRFEAIIGVNLILHCELG
jgi:hypothetical protein